jgi:membrane associated rhomboid family serine protease
LFPIRDHNPSERTPYVTHGLIVMNIAVFLLTMPWAGGQVWLWDRLALYPVAVTHGAWLWGLATHMFLHAGIMHIVGNMLFLWVFGDNLEDQMGRAGFLAFYLACGLMAAAGQVAIDTDSNAPMVGASGAIAGVMGGYLLMFPRARVDVIAIIIIIIRRFTIPAWVLLLAWFGIQLVAGTIGSDDGVAYAAHAAGFLAGIVLALPLFLHRGGPAFWDRNRGRPPHATPTYPPSRIPPVHR